MRDRRSRWRRSWIGVMASLVLLGFPTGALRRALADDPDLVAPSPKATSRPKPRRTSPRVERREEDEEEDGADDRSSREGASIIHPAPSASPSTSPSKALLMLARQAYDTGKFAEPPGQNAIDLSRQVLAVDPDNAPARELESRAAQAEENLARLAASRNDKVRVLEIYKRLFALFPHRQDYLQPILEDEQRKRDLLTGVWVDDDGYVVNLKQDGTYVTLKFPTMPGQEYTGTIDGGEIRWSFDYEGIHFEYRLTSKGPDRLEGTHTSTADDETYSWRLTRRR